MRLLIYILVGAGAAMAVIALAVVLLDDGEQQTVSPQAETGQSAVVTADRNEAAKPSAEGASAGDVDAPSGKSASGKSASVDPVSGNAVSAGNEAGQAATADAVVQIDLAQVRPDGNAVFAGKAPPNSRVTVFEGEIILGTTRADASGEWVIVPEKTLGAGEHLISVGAETEDGNTDVANVALAIKVGEDETEQPLVALLPQTESEVPRLLQSPDDVPDTAQQVVVADTSDASSEEMTPADPSMPMAGPAIAPRALAWKDGGALSISGLSRGGASVTVTADDRTFGAGQVGPDGAWQVSGKVDLERSRRVMLFALADDNGNVVATYELPLATRDLSRGLDGSPLVIVQEGDALWRIAYRSYGEGVKYVDIVRRNAAAINDPDLIFPNQIFALPE